MACIITSRPSKKSKLRRLSFLPRIGITVDFAGKQYGLFQVPFTELLFNMKDRDFSLANIISVSRQQIDEIELPPAHPAKGPLAKKASVRKKKK